MAVARTTAQVPLRRPPAPPARRTAACPVQHSEGPAAGSALVWSSVRTSDNALPTTVALRHRSVRRAAPLGLWSQGVGATPPGCVDDPRREKGWGGHGRLDHEQVWAQYSSGQLPAEIGRSMGRPPDADLLDDPQGGWDPARAAGALPAAVVGGTRGDLPRVSTRALVSNPSRFATRAHSPERPLCLHRAPTLPGGSGYGRLSRPRAARRASCGNATSMSRPPVARRSMASVPWWARTIVATIANPSPDPPLARVRDGSGR